MTATVYIAAPFNRKDYAREVRTILESRGYTSVSSWIDESKDEGVATAMELRAEAIRDLRDLERADLVVICNDMQHPSTTGGVHLEMGYALHAGKKVVLLGERTRYSPFHMLVDVFTHAEDIPNAAAFGF